MLNPDGTINDDGTGELPTGNPPDHPERPNSPWDMDFKLENIFYPARHWWVKPVPTGGATFSPTANARPAGSDKADPLDRLRSPAGPDTTTTRLGEYSRTGSSPTQAHAGACGGGEQLHDHASPTSIPNKKWSFDPAAYPGADAMGTGGEKNGAGAGGERADERAAGSGGAPPSGQEGSPSFKLDLDSPQRSEAYYLARLHPVGKAGSPSAKWRSLYSKGSGTSASLAVQAVGGRTPTTVGHTGSPTAPLGTPREALPSPRGTEAAEKVRELLVSNDLSGATGAAELKITTTTTTTTTTGASPTYVGAAGSPTREELAFQRGFDAWRARNSPKSFA